MMDKEMYRFEKLDVWKKSIELSDRLFDIADRTDMKHCYRFSEQLRAAAMSITNNIAEGSASTSDKDFAQFKYLSPLGIRKSLLIPKPYVLCPLLI